MYAKIFGSNGNGHHQPESAAERVAGQVDLPDKELLRKAMAAANGEKFSALWFGDSSSYSSQSEADLALCDLLAFWTARDAVRMDRLFRQSGLFREKWDSKRGAETYGSWTIDRAISGTTEVYGQPNHNNSGSQAEHSRPQVETEATPAEETETEPEHTTDTGNAEYFTARYHERLRYDHRRKYWLVWNQHHWEADADAEVRRLAKASMRRRFKDAAEIDDPDARSRAAKWAINSESRAKLDALLYLAQSERPIADAGKNWDLEPYLLGVPNGVVDLRTGELRPGRREDRITMQAIVRYDPRATCPRWEQFLIEIFDSAELTGFVHRAIGYSLTTDTSEQCLFVNYGVGANGKGTFANTVKWVLGDYGWNMPFSTIETKDRPSIPNDVAALCGRRFVVASETNDGTRLNESRIKALTGCDPVTARFLHGEFFEFQPVAKFWLSVNHKPIVRDDSHGFWRRIRLIPFAKTFPVNRSLAGELLAEGEGILAWAVRGCLLWQKEHLAAPDIVSEATLQYEKDSDPLAGFINEACDLDPQAETGASELFKHYRRWCDGHAMNEKERLSSTMFGRKFAERFSRRQTEKCALYRGITTRTLVGFSQ